MVSKTRSQICFLADSYQSTACYQRPSSFVTHHSQINCSREILQNLLSFPQNLLESFSFGLFFLLSPFLFFQSASLVLLSFSCIDLLLPLRFELRRRLSLAANVSTCNAWHRTSSVLSSVLFLITGRSLLYQIQQLFSTTYITVCNFRYCLLHDNKQTKSPTTAHTTATSHV